MAGSEEESVMERTFVFAKNDFGKFFNLLRTFGTVNAPVRVSDASFAFKPVSDYRHIAMEALRTILPPKKFFYPQQETMLRYTGTEIADVPPSPDKIVLFGVHPCDLAGLKVLDTIFTAAPGDTHYSTRRANCLIVGLGCMPDKHCFCKSVGTDKVEDGYDLFLTDIGEGFFVQVSTPPAFKLIEGADFLSPANAADVGMYQEFWRKRSESFVIGFDDSNLHATMDMAWDDPIWDELGNRCLSCGNCTPVCPTCYCFDLVDIASLDGNSGERVREWDSCQFVGFAQVAGGHNFRPGPVDRLKFWYRHKLHGFDDPYGFKTCVGCGRCTVSCPSGIDDIVGTVLRIQGNKVTLDV
jgi:sulfhydrogenase subunit beta (sulfur reductase)